MVPGLPISHPPTHTQMVVPCAFPPCSPPFSLPSRDIILESIPTDKPGAHSNLYILTGHQSSY